MTDLQAVRGWLQTSYSVQVPPDWLAVCVEWIQQESGGQPVAATQLQTLVFEQWLMSDLRELGTACLPQDLASSPHTQLSGMYTLQVESMVNIGVPLYGQLQKVKGTLNENCEVSADIPLQPAWEPKPSRMMLLKMTDGQTDITGMEYRSIPTLTSNLQPGFKVVVHGQVMCRRGVLMLTADNLQVLGGEVDSLIEANTPLAVLEQAMQTNSQNNGKTEKQQFSGRILSRKDSSSCGSVQTNNTNKGSKYQTVTQQGIGGTSGPRSNVKTQFVKKEPLTEMTDDWEEDLDYGGILDEPMDDPFTDHAASLSTEMSQDIKPVLESNLSACNGNSHSSGGGMPRWFNGCGHSQMATEFHPQTSSVKVNSGVQQHKRGQRRGSAPFAHQVVTKSEANAVFDGAAWDDDNFEEDSMMSPVIPVQGQSYGGHLQPRTVLASSSAVPSRLNHESKKSNNTQVPQKRSLRETQSVDSSNSGPSIAMPVRANSISSLPNTAALKPDGKTLQVKRDNTHQMSSAPNLDSSPPKSTPPPAKQRKLTSMLSAVHRDIRNLPDTDRADLNPLVHATTGSESSSDGCMHSGVKHGWENKTRDSETADFEQIHHPPNCVMGPGTAMNGVSKPHKPVTQVESNIAKVLQDSTGKSSFNIAQNAAGGPDITFRESHLGVKQEPKSQPEIQGLQSAQHWIATNTEGEAIFTAKGFITTLTDRLRTDKVMWSLSCRITDGIATMEVTLADSVLTKLIGFSARESISLRQQAKKDPKMKGFVQEGLQKCQTALVEFSGLMDVKVKAGDEKPCLINMIQLEKKQRPVK